MDRSTSRKINLRRWAAAAGLSLAGLAAIAIAGCEQSTRGETPVRSDGGNASPSAVGVQTVPVALKDLAKTVEMPGTVEGDLVASLHAKVGGYLEEFAVNPETDEPYDIGDRVERGQVLARLSIPEMQRQLEQREASVRESEAQAEQAKAAIRQSEAELARAKATLAQVTTERAEKQAQLRYREAEFQRYERLVKSQSARPELLDQARFQHEAAKAAVQTVEARIRTAESEVDAAEAAVAKAKADHERALARVDLSRADQNYAQTMLEYGSIRAPFDGHITERWVHPGQFIQPAEGNSAAKPLLTVARTDTVRVSLDVPMNDVRFLDRGDRAVLNRVNVLPGETFEGTVTRFSSSLNVQSRMMRVEVDLPNEDGRLRPGYYGYVTVYVEELPDTPTIPSSALLADGDELYVYVVENGTARKQVVEVGYQDGAVVGIVSGLSGGERVVRAGGGQLADGQPVNAVPAAEGT